MSKVSANAIFPKITGRKVLGSLQVRTSMNIIGGGQFPSESDACDPPAAFDTISSSQGIKL